MQYFDTSGRWRWAALAAVGLLLAGTGCKKKLPPGAWDMNKSKAAAQVKSFVAEKEAQAAAAARADGRELLPEYKALFAASAKGDWPAIKKTFDALARRAPQYDGGGKKDPRLTGTQWATVLETYGVFECYAEVKEKYSTAFALDTIASIPPGSIYFGGTDPGRFMITALCQSQKNGDPFFTLTQNALADGGYLGYLRPMYGPKIYTPSEADSQKCFNDYLTDAQKRLEAKQLKPDEKVTLTGGHVNVSGQVAVMEINGLLAKLIFDKNPDKEFYIEESFPLDWMNPHLEPHGLIMKINREPLVEMAEDTVNTDYLYWWKYLTPMIGPWLNYETPVSEIAAFSEKMRHKNFSGFQGDPEFVTNSAAMKLFSKLRSSQARVYAWRAQNGSAAEKSRMTREADLAYRQAVALCPSSPEAVFGFVNFLLSQGRNADAIAAGEMAMAADARQSQLRDLVQRLKQQPK